MVSIGEHYIDVIMTTMASQIIRRTVVYSTVYSDADQRKHQISASLAFVWGIHRDQWIPRTKGQLRGKCFHLMTSSWILLFELGFGDVWYNQEIVEVHAFIVCFQQRMPCDIYKQGGETSKREKSTRTSFYRVYKPEFAFSHQ